ncbi:MAG: hypothetical protein KKA97_05960 [Actinobacteria bacterium]|nr:hypothetical protein [Actinomycetota bacterium]
MDIEDLLAAAARDVRPLADQKGVSLEVEVPTDLPSLSLDAGLFDRVIGNLLGNAVKFTEQGGVRVRALYDGASLHVEVYDTGIGIAPEHLSHLFDEFQQVSEGDGRTHEGNGLGLALARRVAALLGGQIAVESTVGEGSRFRVSVPAPRSAETRFARTAPSAYASH